MTAKRTRRPRPSRAEHEPHDIRHIFALHLEASQRRDQLLEEIRELRAAGKVTAAKALMVQVDDIQRCLAALEREVRPQNPHAS